ncbi:hypothetical protein BLNAU_12941 [Blattamonas nauphoetae]|uniref:Uncharacterized protein n=1 Tax=Blattamonas nauphoetae TaxID=2049346 RepID=A0ABQ9XPN2_9EUKA|nr:hypothetical protein BLNAU_12941 [Blattamonas nauphoetae]
MADLALASFHNVLDEIHHWESNLSVIFTREHACRLQAERENNAMRVQFEQLTAELMVARTKLKVAEQEIHNLTCDHLLLKSQLESQLKMTELAMASTENGFCGSFDDINTVKGVPSLSDVIKQTLQDFAKNQSINDTVVSSIPNALDNVVDAICNAISKQSVSQSVQSNRSSSPSTHNQSNGNASMDRRSTNQISSQESMFEWIRDVDEKVASTLTVQVYEQLETAYHIILSKAQESPQSFHVEQLVAHNILQSISQIILNQNPSRFTLTPLKPSLSQQPLQEIDEHNDKKQHLFLLSLRVLSFILSSVSSLSSTPNHQTGTVHAIIRFILNSNLPVQLINAFCHLILKDSPLPRTGGNESSVSPHPVSVFHQMGSLEIGTEGDATEQAAILEQLLILILQLLLFATSHHPFVRPSQFDNIKFLFRLQVISNLPNPSLLVLLLSCLLLYQSLTTPTQAAAPTSSPSTSRLTFVSKIRQTTIPQTVSSIRTSPQTVPCLNVPSEQKQSPLDWKALALTLAKCVELDDETRMKENSSLLQENGSDANAADVKLWMGMLMNSWGIRREEQNMVHQTLSNDIESSVHFAQRGEKERESSADKVRQESGITVIDKHFYNAFVTSSLSPGHSSLPGIKLFQAASSLKPALSPDMSDTSSGDRLFSSQSSSHNLPSFKTSIPLQNHLSAVRTLSAHPTRLSYLSGGDDGMLRLWGFSSFAYRQSRVDSQTPFVLSRSSAPILATRFLEQRKEAVSATSHGELRISAIPPSFDYTSDGSHHKLNSLSTFALSTAHNGAICSVDASKDEKALATCSTDGTVGIWVFMNDSGGLIRDCEDKVVKEWEWNEGKQGDGSWELVPDRSSLYVGQRDNLNERVINHPTYTQPLRVEHEPLVRALSITHPQGAKPTQALFNPINQNQLFIGYRNGDWAEYDLHHTKRISLFTYQDYSKIGDASADANDTRNGNGLGHWITSMSFSTDSGKLLIANKNSRVTLVDTRADSANFSIGQTMNSGSGLSCLDWTSDESVFAVCSFNNEMKLFDIRRAHPSHMLVRTTHKQVFGSGITTIRFHRMYKLCVVGGADSMLKVFVTSTESDDLPGYVTSNNRRLKEIREKEKMALKTTSQRGEQQRKPRIVTSQH